MFSDIHSWIWQLAWFLLWMYHLFINYWGGRGEQVKPFRSVCLPVCQGRFCHILTLGKCSPFGTFYIVLSWTIPSLSARVLATSTPCSALLSLRSVRSRSGEARVVPQCGALSCLKINHLAGGTGVNFGGNPFPEWFLGLAQQPGAGSGRGRSVQPCGSWVWPISPGSSAVWRKARCWFNFNSQGMIFLSKGKIFFF